MTIEGSQLLQRIANRQWQIIGEQLTFVNLPEDGLVTVGKKKKQWYHVYKMTEEQVIEWRDWMYGELKKEGMKEEKICMTMMYLELRYGMLQKEKEP